MPALGSNLQNWLELLAFVGALIGAAIGFAKWLHEVQETQKLRKQELQWKQTEALIERITAFGDTPGAHNAILMLGSPDREIPLWDKEKSEDRYVRVTWNEVAEALVPADTHLTPKLSAIRDSFGDFLNRLTHIALYQRSSLLDAEDVKMFVSHWAGRLSSDEPYARNIRLYIRYLGMEGVVDLFRKVGGLDIAKMFPKDEEKYQEWVRSRRNDVSPSEEQKDPARISPDRV